MKAIRIALLSLIGIGIACAASAADADKDVKGSKDHPRISRFKGAVVVKYKASDFGHLDLLLSNPHGSEDTWKSQSIEGRLTDLVYKIPEGHDSHEVLRSYETALQKGGFKTLYRCVGTKECGGFDFPVYFQLRSGGAMGQTQAESQRYLAARRQGPEGDTYVMLYSYFQFGETQAILTVVDVAPLKEGSVTVSAEEMGRDIGATGHAVVYGVYFDTDSAVVKPQSDAALKEMAKLLAQSPSLKVFIVGHTDNVGLVAHNLDLSGRRAEAVVKALTTKHGVAVGRLEGRGVGPLAPVALNRTEDGRAKNRRVELVER